MGQCTCEQGLRGQRGFYAESIKMVSKINAWVTQPYTYWKLTDNSTHPASSVCE